MSSPFFFRGAAVVMAATMGVGIFALPYVVKEAGWVTSLFYLILVLFVIIQTHFWYWQVLEKSEKQRLLGLVGRFGGKPLFLVGFLSIVVGLLLVLLAYLVLAGSFFSLLFPHQQKIIGVLIVWFLGSLPLLIGVRRLTSMEFIGAAATFTILLGLFFRAISSGGSFTDIPAVTSQFFLPFGPFLFALAGWTALEPVFDTEGRSVKSGFRGVAWGTTLSAFFYVVFIASIFLMSSVISSDTVSALVFWPFWERSILSFLGLLLIVNAYVPIAWEVHTALDKDLRLGQWSILVPMTLPLFLYFFGLNNFFETVSLVGGLFLSLEYLCIVFVASKMLTIDRKQKLLMGFVSLIFSLAALYELFTFLLK